MKPVIGIITCGFENERQFVSQNYIEAIQRSGALPLLLPILPSTAQTSIWIISNTALSATVFSSAAAATLLPSSLMKNRWMPPASQT